MTDEQVQTATTTKEFPCKQCGAAMTYAPGSRSIQCAYCNHTQQIPQSEQDIQ